MPVASKRASREAIYAVLCLGQVAPEVLYVVCQGHREESTHTLVVDPADRQTFDVIVTGDEMAGGRVLPAIWPTPILNGTYDLAFDTLAVSSPGTGADLRVMMQTSRSYIRQKSADPPIG